MFCSFDAVPKILRLYGKGYAILPEDPEWEVLSAQFTIYPSTRQIIKATISKVQTSCGFGVPQYEYTGERNLHFEWAEKKGTDGLQNYIRENNLFSIDGLPTKFAGQ